MPGSAVYNATKGAVNTITKALAKELGPKKIRVIGVGAGHGRDGGHGRVGANDPNSEFRKRYIEGTRRGPHRPAEGHRDGRGLISPRTRLPGSAARRGSFPAAIADVGVGSISQCGVPFHRRLAFPRPGGYARGACAGYLVTGGIDRGGGVRRLRARAARRLSLGRSAIRHGQSAAARCGRLMENMDRAGQRDGVLSAAGNGPLAAMAAVGRGAVLGSFD